VAFAGERGVEGAVLTDVPLAVAEMVAGVALHGNATNAITVDADIRDDKVTVVVRRRRRGADTERRRSSDPAWGWSSVPADRAYSVGGRSARPRAGSVSVGSPPRPCDPGTFPRSRGRWAAADRHRTAAAARALGRG
jgi:hypothetical protein